MKIKNFILAVFICFIAFFVSGCVKWDTEITIDKNGKATVCDTWLFNKKLLPMMETTSDELYERQTSTFSDITNLETSFIDDGDYVGTQFVQKFKNIKNLMLIAKYFTPNVPGKNDYKFIKINKNIFVTNYVFDCNVDFKNIKDERLKKMFAPDSASFASTKLIINIPTKAVKSNASSVMNNGLRHIWNFSLTNNYNVLLEFNIINYFNIILGIIGILFLILGFIFELCKISEIAQKSLFCTSSIIFVYFVVAQLLYGIADLNFTIYDICVMFIFSCLTLVSIVLYYKK